MKKVEFLIDEKFAGIMTVTLVGGVGTDSLNVTMGAHDVKEDCKIIVDSKGSFEKYLDAKK